MLPPTRCVLVASAMALSCGEERSSSPASSRAPPAPPIEAPERRAPRATEPRDAAPPEHAPADPQAEGPTQVIPGLWYRRITLPETRVTVELFEADLSEVSVRVLDARTSERSAATVAELRAEAGAIAALNGTFFDEQVRPLGLLVDGGQELSPLRQADWGVLSMTHAGQVSLVHTRDWTPDPSVEFAVQCGPRVVIDGEVPKLEPQIARRTAACVRSPTSLALLVTREVIGAEHLARWLAAPAPAGLGCTDALLLDGGPSTQLDAGRGDWSVSVIGGWPVPNAIALVPRNAADPPDR